MPVGGGWINWFIHQMRITIVYRYFWPDTAPYSLLLAKMVPWLVGAGHELNIISGQPNYVDKNLRAPKFERVFNAYVTRVSLIPGSVPAATKMNMILFSFIAAIRILFGPKQDIIWFGTTPPVIQAFLLNLVAQFRGAKTIYQIQDIHPKIAVQAGELKHSLLTRLLELMDRITLKSCDLVTVLSEDMKEQVLAIADNNVKCHVINNFAVETGLKREVRTAGFPIRFCYSGNIGTFQNAAEMIREFSKIDPEIVVLDVIGDGKLRAQLEMVCNEMECRSVRFLGVKNTLETAKHIAECDFGVVCLKPNLHHYAFPSKIQSYLAVGVPLFAFVDDDSSIASMIDQESLGYHISWSAGADEIQEKIKFAAYQADLGKIDYEFPEHLWHPDSAKEKWLALIDEMGRNK